jgi:MFS family permease
MLPSPPSAASCPLVARGSATRCAGSRMARVVLATAFGFVVVQLDVTIVNVALARIGADLGTSVTGLQWVVDAYTLAFAAAMLSAGVIGDLLGARRASAMTARSMSTATLRTLALNGRCSRCGAGSGLPSPGWHPASTHLAAIVHEERSTTSATRGSGRISVACS